MYRTQHLIYILITCLSFNLIADDMEIKRTAFSLPLVKLIALCNKKSSEFKNVEVLLNGKKEYAIITPDDDYHMTIIRHGKEQIIYAEQPNAHYMLNEFESQQMDRVVNGFIETLSLLERFLEKKQWNRCRYLDCFFPRFLKSFYYLSCTALNSTTALPKETNFSDQLFDISLNSKKTDERVRHWEQNKENQIKLRIASRELIFHFANWRSNELNFFDPNTKIEYSPELKEAYNMFIRIYFNI